jgi:hypothetical protein
MKTPETHFIWGNRRKPVWLSTAGAGVSWLHVRLDDRPKYYGYRPYQEASGFLASGDRPSG